MSESNEIDYDTVYYALTDENGVLCVSPVGEQDGDYDRAPEEVARLARDYPDCIYFTLEPPTEPIKVGDVINGGTVIKAGVLTPTTTLVLLFNPDRSETFSLVWVDTRSRQAFTGRWIPDLTNAATAFDGTYATERTC